MTETPKVKKHRPDTVLRGPRNFNYKVVGCACMDDVRLSFRSRGVLMYLLTRPEGWKFWHGEIVTRGTDGKDSVSVALAELQKMGYLRITPVRGERGRISSTTWDVSETPNTKFDTLPCTTSGNPGSGTAASGESAPSSKDPSDNQGLTKPQDVNKNPPRSARAKAKGHDTWLTPYWTVWEAKFGKGSVPVGASVKVLRRLDLAHGSAKVAAHLRNYLSVTEARYLSLPKFEETFPQWATGGIWQTGIHPEGAPQPGRRQ